MTYVIYYMAITRTEIRLEELMKTNGLKHTNDFHEEDRKTE